MESKKLPFPRLRRVGLDDKFLSLKPLNFGNLLLFRKFWYCTKTRYVYVCFWHYVCDVLSRLLHYYFSVIYVISLKRYSASKVQHQLLLKSFYPSVIPWDEDILSLSVSWGNVDWCRDVMLCQKEKCLKNNTWRNNSQIFINVTKENTLHINKIQRNPSRIDTKATHIIVKLLKRKI